MKVRIVAALDTGMRKDEMLRGQLKRVDFKHAFIELPRRVLVKDVYGRNTKNDKTRRVPITPRLMKLQISSRCGAHAGGRERGRPAGRGGVFR